jgi:hypothetical protein
LALNDLELHALDLVVEEAIKRHAGCRMVVMMGMSVGGEGVENVVFVEFEFVVDVLIGPCL